MSFGDHLEELRRRMILALIAPLPLAILAFFFSTQLIELLLDPLFSVYAFYGLPLQVHELAPAEFLLSRLKLSIIVAVVASAPWILWQAWLFISPGLFAHERRFVYFLIPGSALLTVAGAALLYFGMLPLILHVLIMFGGALRDSPREVTAPAVEVTEAAEAPERIPALPVLEEDPTEIEEGHAWIKMPERVLRIATAATPDGQRIEIFELSLRPSSRLIQQYRISEYINFVLFLLLGMVIAFQMPLVILLLGWLGIATIGWLRRQRRYAFMVCAIVAAAITPPDPISLLVMLFPLYGLYELGILLLVIAPAGAVAEGRFTWRSDKNRSGRENSSPSAEPEVRSPRETVERESGPNEADMGGEDRDER